MNKTDQIEFPPGREALKRLSDNRVCQAWILTQQETNSRLFVKTPSISTEIDESYIERVLDNSFRYQKELRSRLIHTALSRTKYHNRLFIEYPYLTSPPWRPLDIEFILENYTQIFERMCICVDYLHLMGFVHRDLKLSNFMVANMNGKVLLKLIDLDFLAKHGVKSNGNLIGTPEHIGPEIVRGESFFPKSDNYSLGISIKRGAEDILQSNRQMTMQESSIVENLSRLGHNLTKTNISDRPLNLTTAMLDTALISIEGKERIDRRLLRKIISSKLNQRLARSYSDPATWIKLISEDCKVLGFHFDLYQVLASRSASTNYRELTRLMHTIIADSKIERISSYFHITIPDTLATDLLDIHKNRSLVDIHQADDPDITVDLIEAIIDESAVLIHSGKILTSFLLLKCVISINRISTERCYDRLYLKVLMALAQASRLLMRFTESIDYLRQIVDRSNIIDPISYEATYKLSSLLITNGNSKEALEIINARLEDTTYKATDPYYFHLKILRCWINATKEKGEPSLVELRELIKNSQEQNAVSATVKGLYTQAVILWNKGLYEQAQDALEEAVEIARAKDNGQETLLPLAFLSHLCTVRADYHASIRYGKQAFNLAKVEFETSHVSTACLAIAASCTRLGEFKKADYWLQQLRSCGFMSAPVKFLSNYYICQAFININRGDLNATVADCVKVIQMPHDQMSNNIIGKAYHNLIEVASMRWEKTRTLDYTQKAITLYEKIGDRGSLAEIEALVAFEEYDSGKSPSIAQLENVYSRLMSLGCFYFAGLALFRLLLNTTTSNTHIHKSVDKFLETVATSSCPLFGAIRMLQDMYQHGVGESSQIKILKSIYVNLSSTGNKYLSFLVSRQISLLYKKTNLRRHEMKFIEESLRIANELGNNTLHTLLQSALAEPSRTSDMNSRLVETLREISIIFSDIRNQTDVLDSLLRFAVEQTGAERGVLLLRDEVSGDLWTAAHVDCDEQTLSDVESFSKTIPNRASEMQSTIVIDDAMSDKRTGSLPSIAIHNIRSVACAPIRNRDTVIGAVYLDHHSLVSLFSKEDIYYFEAITNFLSVAIETSDVLARHKLLGKKLMGRLAFHSDNQAFLTEHPMLIEMLSSIPRIAESNSPVLITGESGTGKEVLCRLLHSLSKRSKKPLVMLNCAAIASTLIEAELFGIGKNVATGVASREGKFQSADEGTMFLDEIGDMPLEIQAKVLRVLEYQVIEKVGSNVPIRTDIRFVYATNKNLSELIKQGKFREDLFYRINTFSIEIPPLRERKCDILLLLEHFTKQLQMKHGKTMIIEPDALEVIYNYRWPGNVRELKNFADKFFTLFAGKRIRASDLPTHFFKEIDDTSHSKDFLERMQAEKIKAKLEENNWNQSRTARSLGIPLSTLRDRLKKFKISRLN